MLHGTGTDHVQVNVAHAAPEVLAALDHRRVIATRPDRTLAALAAVVPLGELPLLVPHQPGYRFDLFGRDQQMHVIRRDAVGQERDFRSLEMQTQPLLILAARWLEAQQPFTVVAAVRQVAGETRKQISVGPWHMRGIIRTRHGRSRYRTHSNSRFA